ncbi:hypothetical protein KNE206_67700 [Kitasatospora sp. NE20-6]|uniref:hypothetical protein n=1 Tax=Kitasatospora sp. NE20-6 TaxID=2859066 RepID=UPI0034DCA2E4
MTGNPTTVEPDRADTAHYRIRAALLLLTPEGRIVLVPTPSPDGSTRPALPGGIVPTGVVPKTVAARRTAEATNLIGLTAGRQLAVSLQPGGAGRVGEALIVHDHPVLSGAQVAALTADAGNRATAVLVAPWELERSIPGEAREILAALAARIEDITAFLEYGHPTMAAEVDLPRLLATPPRPTVGTWCPGPAADVHTVTGVGGWLLTPDGRAVLVHDPATGHARLPGGLVDGTDPTTALTYAGALLGLHIDPVRTRLLGHHHSEARIATVVTHIGAQPKQPGPTRLARILATPAQVQELCPGQVADRELEALVSAAAQLGVPTALRRPVTLVPDIGIMPGRVARSLSGDGPPGAAVVNSPDAAQRNRAG